LGGLDKTNHQVWDLSSKTTEVGILTGINRKTWGLIKRTELIAPREMGDFTIEDLANRHPPALLFRAWTSPGKLVIDDHSI
jgi:hypothetical protein